MGEPEQPAPLVQHPIQARPGRLGGLARLVAPDRRARPEAQDLLESQATRDRRVPSGLPAAMGRRVRPAFKVLLELRAALARLAARVLLEALERRAALVFQDLRAALG